MTLVAVHAVVDISADALVLGIRFRLRMAIGALENGVVIRVRMARRAHTVRVAMVDGELCVLRVIESRVLPVRGVVAVLARCREELRLRRVAWIRGLVVIGLVAGNARRAGQVVIVVDVAIGASPRRNGMGTGQREAGLRVIELAVRPLNGVMAHLASGREAGVVYRILRTLEIGLVARNARRNGDVVIVVDVAIGASPRRNGMGTGQREAGLRVVELAIRPLHGVMTLIARRWETGVRHRSLRVLIIGLVARVASRVGDVVVVVDVAVGANPRRNLVRPR